MASSLDAHLGLHAGDDPLRRKVAETIRHLAAASVEVRYTMMQVGAADGLGHSRQVVNAGGDVQKTLDVVADAVFLEAAKASPVAVYGSEEQDHAVVLSSDGALAIAIDPLDGSSNIETNVSVGTIFSILPVESAHRAEPAAVFMQPGSKQLAAGFFIYGPQLLLVVSLGKSTQVFGFSPSSGDFVELHDSIAIPEEAHEFAINASNYRHWDEAVRVYIDDCLAGTDGPRERDFNMRWIASMVADCYRILLRGGIFLYPGDGRKGYSRGRLRLLYEANPIAFCIENAGGLATDGVNRILDIVPEALHQRTPLVCGSRGEVMRVGRYLSDPSALADRSLLAGKGSLFKG